MIKWHIKQNLRPNLQIYLKVPLETRNSAGLHWNFAGEEHRNGRISVLCGCPRTTDSWWRHRSGSIDHYRRQTWHFHPGPKRSLAKVRSEFSRLCPIFFLRVCPFFPFFSFYLFLLFRLFLGFLGFFLLFCIFFYFSILEKFEMMFNFLQTWNCHHWFNHSMGRSCWSLEVWKIGQVFHAGSNYQSQRRI